MSKKAHGPLFKQNGGLASKVKLETCGPVSKLGKTASHSLTCLRLVPRVFSRSTTPSIRRCLGWDPICTSASRPLLSVSPMGFLKSDKWIPIRGMRLNLDPRTLLSHLQRSRSGKNGGYITPPLNSSRSSARYSLRRIGIIALWLLFLWHLCGFSIFGHWRGNKKVVIVLGANLGGGYLSSRTDLICRRLGCQELRGLGYGKVEYTQ